MQAAPKEFVAQRVWAVGGIYLRQKSVRVSTSGDVLELAYGKSTTVIHFDEIEELDVEAHINFFLLAVWHYISWRLPWTPGAWWPFVALRVSSGWINIRFRRRIDRDAIVDALLSRGIRITHAISTVEN